MAAPCGNARERSAMLRRHLVALGWVLVGGLTYAVPAPAQPAPGMHSIGFVNVGDAVSGTVNVAAFRAWMADLGYIERRNLAIEYRWADQNADVLPGLIVDLVRTKPEVIPSTGGPFTLRAVKAAVTKLPVVFTMGDPVSEGIVANYAKPGIEPIMCNVDAAARRLKVTLQRGPATLQRADEVID